MLFGEANTIANPSLDSSIGSASAWGLVDRGGPDFESRHLLNNKAGLQPVEQIVGFFHKNLKTVQKTVKIYFLKVKRSNGAFCYQTSGYSIGEIQGQAAKLKIV